MTELFVEKNLKRTFYTDTKFSAKKTFKTYLTILLHFPVKKTSFKTYFVAVTILHVWILDFSILLIPKIYTL
jgi:hypothetical protein